MVKVESFILDYIKVLVFYVCKIMVENGFKGDVIINFDLWLV